MGMKDNTMSHICLTERQLVGEHKWKGRIDLFNVVMIGLSDNLPGHDETYELHRLLGTLLSKQMEVNEKLDIMENEYHIPTEKEELNIMCNLSQGIKEDGILEGILEGKAEQTRSMSIELYKAGVAIETIAQSAKVGIEKIQNWLIEAQLLNNKN